METILMKFEDFCESICFSVNEKARMLSDFCIANGLPADRTVLICMFILLVASFMLFMIGVRLNKPVLIEAGFALVIALWIFILANISVLWLMLRFHRGFLSSIGIISLL